MYFNEGSIDAILAEHVWEHLAEEEGLAAAKCCYRYLRPGGYLRVAVPDGFHPDANFTRSNTFASLRSVLKTLHVPSQNFCMKFSTRPSWPGRPHAVSPTLSAFSRRIRRPIALRAFRTMFGTLTKRHRAFFGRLRGQFAFAIWDESGAGPDLLARSLRRMPIALVAAGRLVALCIGDQGAIGFRLGGKRIDLRGIHDVWTFFGTPGPVTCFEGVSSLLPGRFIDLSVNASNSANKIVDTPYWQMDFPDRGQEEDNGHQGALVDEYESIMLRAIERRLNGGAAIAAYSSGGLDSSLLVAMAAKLRGKPLDSYTFDVEYPGHHEIAHWRPMWRVMSAVDPPL